MKNKVLIISLLYCILGTYCALSVYPPYYNDFVLYGLLITFPVNFIGLMIMYTSKNYVLVIIVQVIVFFVFYRILKRMVK